MFTVAASVSALVAVTVIALGGYALAQLADARTALIDVADPAQFTAQQLAAALLDQEAGIRGLALTGRPEFVEPYRSGRDAEAEATARLRELPQRELAVVGPELDQLLSVARVWQAVYVEPVLAGAPDVPGPDRGRVLFDQVRATSRVLVAEVEQVRGAARERVEGAVRSITVVGIAVAVLLAAFLVAAGIGLRRRVLAPVSELAAQVRDIVSGGVRHPVSAAGPREILELGEDIEAMRAHILRDLDDVQETNRRLDEQARDLERSNRDLEQFAYVASHDLQEPLRKVSSFCQLLQRRYGGQLDERADQYIEFAVDGASRMQRLINDLLAFSRVGRTTDHFVPVPLGEIATAASTLLESARVDVDGQIVIGELPTVPGDPGLLRQLLVNLIGNGLKFHRDGVAPVVELTARRVEDGWEVTVTDNGIGIEPQYTDKVFVIFQRLHGRDVYAGTGIGLALSKKIVEFHDGSIRLDVADGPGTAVRLTLPATPEEISA